LAQIGLINSINAAAAAIDSGRKGFAIKGKAEEGRIFYERGIALAMSAFQEASNQRFASTAVLETIILAEYTFLSQELEFCEKTDKESFNSLTQALQLFDEAFLVLKIIEDKTFYQVVEKSFSHKREYRFKGFPKDAFHVAFGSHKARLMNILKTPGLDPIEKALLKQRLANISAGQEMYVVLQRKALVN